MSLVNLAKELGEDKIHQYGINSFRLYRLPTLKNGSITGLLGRNGTGKSTIINILAGNMKPNLGKYNTEVTWNEILRNFQGTELKSHFEKIAYENIRVSIKPQLVKVDSLWNFKQQSTMAINNNNNNLEADRMRYNTIYLKLCIVA
jgi:ATP-binding cassette, sub-family E, member 1